MKSRFMAIGGIGIICMIVLLAVVSHGRREAEGTKVSEGYDGKEHAEEITEDVPEEKKEDVPEDDLRETVRVEEISFERISGQEIRIIWTDQKNPFIREYFVQRRRNGESVWETRGTVSSDGSADNRELSYVDVLEEAMPQQYEYRIDVSPADEAAYDALEGEEILASNILICIDPGHYAGQNAVDAEGIFYAEGDFTLELALELKKILKESCGITAYLTRETGSVSIGGYMDGGLDHSHISLRGEYAGGSDLFLSIHTNANLEGANGYPTDSQPIEIMKPIIIANTAACESETALAVGNAVGSYLAKASCELGLAMPDKFRKAECAEDIVPWTDAWNDGVDTIGSICRRMGEHGDYYGVLRGAAGVGVPGMIIEHGFHTVPEMREMAAFGELKTEWARADARGIAEGFGVRMEE